MAMFFARIVIPRSRSRSLESRICSPDQLRFAKPPALPQHAIDQRRLAVVDVGDDGDVADVLAANRVAHGRALADCRFDLRLFGRERVWVR